MSIFCVQRFNFAKVITLRYYIAQR